MAGEPLEESPWGTDNKWADWHFGSKLWGAAAVVTGLIVGIAVGRFEAPVVAEAAGQSATVIIGTGAIFWSVLGRRSFWLFMAAIVAVHGVVICAAPWPAHHQINKADLFLGLGDLLLMIGIGALVARLTRKPDTKT